MKNIFRAAILAVCLSPSACKDSAKKYPFDFVDRSDVFSTGKKTDPMLLVVGITVDGRLSLNKIETGTIADTTLLREKVGAVFDDREKNGFVEKEVVIDPHGEVETEDLEKLIECLAEAKAAPIRVVKDNL
jgi:hypothetical protein